MLNLADNVLVLLTVRHFFFLSYGCLFVHVSSFFVGVDPTV